MKNLQRFRFGSDNNECKMNEEPRQDQDNVCVSSPEKTLMEYYREYKERFAAGDFTQIANIMLWIEKIDSEAPIIYLIKGELALHRGDCENSYRYLSQYTKTASAADPYAISVIGLWNGFMGHWRYALSQFTECLESPLDPQRMAFVIFNAACAKKELKFFDSSLSYFSRLLAVPEGYRFFPCIQLEIIHILILKMEYKSALDVLTSLRRRCPCVLSTRLRAYAYYMLGNTSDLLKNIRSSKPDPYVLYLIGRAGKDDASLGVDVSYCFEEALRGAGENPHIYNSYGNFYFEIGRFSDAEEQYRNALAIDPEFEPAIWNLRLIKQKNLQSGDYRTAYKGDVHDDGRDMCPRDTIPDIGETGFMNIWSMFGYKQFNSKDRGSCMYSPLRVLLQNDLFFTQLLFE